MSATTAANRGRNIDLGAAYDEASERFAAANPKSLAHYERACRSLPGGNTRTGMYYAPFPLTMAKGEGAALWDLDEHRYRDFAGDFSAGLYGHSNPVIRAALDKALDGGITFGSTNAYEERLAALVCARFPSIELVRFCNSGTEANTLALATACAVTGRATVMVFEGAYHGGTLSFPPGGSPLNLPFRFVVAPYNDSAGSEALFAAHGADLAAVLVEPLQGAGGCIPGDPVFLESLRTACTKAGALLIFDEVMTSRLGPSGLQGALGIAPDLTVLGKYVGGGMTVGAFGGRRQIMARFDPREPGHFVHHGTFNNNVATLAAGAAGLEKIYTPEAANALTASGERFRARLNEIGRRHDAPFQATGMGSLLNVHFLRGEIRSHNDLAKRDPRALDLFHLEMIERGIYLTRRGYMALSLPLAEQDFDAFADAVDRFLASYGHLLEG